ncbi:peptidyl-Lys metalloendopeptidase [Dendrothele bispora CBS 962.96]|uniref:Peptidyl-Lys metalloendopeptidase n=1 Tax=Dendrothele bispora (strain CBS 962.96) TaxID=1314807 RepID=A0A4S8LMY3_DENBC|nr:peptidyl-Lys metalloendopeptidase [Dendrothele bispora CBS 962.96]
MFSSTLRTALVALCLSAISVSADLTLKVSGPEAAAGVDNLKITTTFTNTGDEALHLLNDPRSPLTSTATDSFRITSSSGASPAFKGLKIKYSPEYAAKSNVSDVVTVLAPGQSLDVEHDLSSAYNFTSSGEDTYEIEALNKFFVVDPSTLEVSEIHASQDSAHQSKLTGTLSVSSKRAINKRASFVGCSSSEQSQVNSAVSAAATYANNARDYLSSHTSSTTRYTTWFGTYTSSRHSTVLTHFTNMAAQGYSGYTYDCTCTESGVFAFVNLDDFGTIHLCPVFWDVAVTGTDSKAGTLIHESSHFTQLAGTDDHVYGQSGAKSLAQSNPTQAIDNADSHEYFAENNPALS